MILADQGFDFLARGGDEPYRPGEDERDLVRQGDVVVLDRGQCEDLALLTDRENQVLASKTFRDEAANLRGIGLPRQLGPFPARPCVRPAAEGDRCRQPGLEPASFRAPVVSR